MGAGQRDGFMIHQLNAMVLNQALEAAPVHKPLYLPQELPRRSQLLEHQRCIRIAKLRRVALHADEGGIIRPDQLKRRGVDLHDCTNEEVRLAKPAPCGRIFPPCLVGKFALIVARVAGFQLPNANAIIRHEDGNDKPPLLVLRNIVCQFCLKAHNLVGIGNEPLHVPLRRPRSKSQATGQGVLLGPEADVWRISDLRVNPEEKSGLFNLDGTLLKIHVLLVEVPSENVTVVEEKVAAQHIHILANHQILWFVDDRLRLHHGRNCCDVGILSQCRSSPKGWIRITARIP
mmetsp:Transcript_9242/g.15800  ORF Transcript_9242/g.15800 Transcript_9242/m.15800 type:complete len:289 (-) Transcript_9242:982-1848(-)